jgi:glycogen debranching enzyme
VIRSPWIHSGPVASLAVASGPVTAVNGQSFCISASNGDFFPNLPQGLLVLDVRVLSHWELRVEGARLEPLGSSVPVSHDARFVGRGAPLAGQADPDLVVFRRRSVGQGMREVVVLRNHSLRARTVTVELAADADFASIFEVKTGSVAPRVHDREVVEGALRFRDRARGRTTTVRADRPADLAIPGRLTWQVDLDPGGEASICLDVAVTLRSVLLQARFRCGADDEPEPSAGGAGADLVLPALDTDSPQLLEALEQSVRDLRALQITDPEHPGVPAIAAGAPWYMTVFGRDSLLTAWMALVLGTDLAGGVLETLARSQGTGTDPATEEQPGRILHEIRFDGLDGAAGLALGGGDVYYGSVDATPLFVALLGEAWRWGLPLDRVRGLLPAADAALTWMAELGDRDGDGYLEYQRSTPDGLENQGWKDSADAIRFADGRLAEPPIALCEVQGYAYAAHVARADLAEAVGDRPCAEAHRSQAAALRTAFNRDFWLPDHGWFALALDRDKRPVDALASNMGHCLWSGIVDEDKAAAVGDRLLSPELFSGWGIRTLATSMTAYNPVSYHNGSVWPHDSALAAAGLARYGLLDHAHRVVGGLLSAAAAHRGRLPELFAGFSIAEHDEPAPYPSSCSPQAWAAAVPLLLLRIVLGLDAGPPGEARLDPHLPPGTTRLRVTDLPVGGGAISVELTGDGVRSTASDGLVLRRSPRTR